LAAKLGGGDHVVVVSLAVLGGSVDCMSRTMVWLGRRGIRLTSLAESIDVTAAVPETGQGGGGIAIKRTRGRPSTLSARQLDTAASMKQKGHSIREIADWLGLSRSTIHRVLSAAEPCDVAGAT
jgi:DNA invertase Pin-like site-specific DNA recombinase